MLLKICLRPFAWVPSALALLSTTAARAQDISADPAGSGVLVSAMHWLEGTLLGTVATVVAVIAVATVGLLMLTGRINWRYGATVNPGLLHPVRRREHRRGDPVDRADEPVNGIERDPLFVALTRPQMFAGVTSTAIFIVNGAGGTGLFPIFRSA